MYGMTTPGSPVRFMGYTAVRDVLELELLCKEAEMLLHSPGRAFEARLNDGPRSFHVLPRPGGYEVTTEPADGVQVPTFVSMTELPDHAVGRCMREGRLFTRSI